MKTHSIYPKTEAYPFAYTVSIEFVPFIRCWFVGCLSVRVCVCVCVCVHVCQMFSVWSAAYEYV